jgi:hypothetical protein
MPGGATLIRRHTHVCGSEQTSDGDSVQPVFNLDFEASRRIT